MHGNAVQQHEEYASEITHATSHDVRWTKYKLLGRLGDCAEHHLGDGDHQISNGQVEEEDVGWLLQESSLAQERHDDEQVPREGQNEVECEDESHSWRSILQVFVYSPKSGIVAGRTDIIGKAIELGPVCPVCLVCLVHERHVHEACQVIHLVC